MQINSDTKKNSNNDKKQSNNQNNIKKVCRFRSDKNSEDDKIKPIINQHYVENIDLDNIKTIRFISHDPRRFYIFITKAQNRRLSFK